MKRYFIFLFMSVAFAAQVVAGATFLLPQPTSFVKGKGQFVFNAKTTIFINIDNKDMQELATYAKDFFSISLHQVVLDNRTKSRNTLSLICTGTEEQARNALNDTTLQAYTIEVTAKSIVAKSPTPTGLFYALQTLRQLHNQGTINSCTISDAPRFIYRGMMLDCSRHFWTPSFIKKQIDVMAFFKMSRLHLHLVDGGGWRMEIKKYPRLTTHTAYRTESDWDKWWGAHDRRYCLSTDSGAYGGYYTQDELRDIVRYAKERHIIVVPEIEMPGHSDEVLFAYPNLSCQGKPYTGSDFCAGNDSVFTFLQEVLEEVLEVFPSEYIHIGGDEASRQTWETCLKCQQRMSVHGLKNTAELQAYFITRMGDWLESKGRKLLGWDEILDGYLAPNASVMSWRGEEGGLKAASMGHTVIMTPGKYCYLDHYQDVPNTQPKALGGYVPLEQVYSYDPVPKERKGTMFEKMIIGLQGNLWTEQIPTEAQAEYMLYPRLLALAETGWVQSKMPYDDFRARVLSATDWMREKGYNAFNLHKEIGRRPESLQPTQTLAKNKKVTYLSVYAPQYRAAGDSTLTDGLRGSWSFGDERWQGFITDKGLDVVIDMDEETEISSISADFMQGVGVEIYLPSIVELSISSDNKNYTLLDKHEYPLDRSIDYSITPYVWIGKIKGRYIRLKALPATKDGWVFTDEVIVR